MDKIILDYSKTIGMIDEAEMEQMAEKVKSAHKMLHEKTGPGNEYLGWVDLPVKYDKEEFDNVVSAAQEIKSSSDALVVIGIGGSYLGARAAVDALNHSFHNMQKCMDRKSPLIFFAGNNISPKYIKDMMVLLENKDVSINVISKSGTTTEPAIAFRYFKEFMEKKYGKKKAKKRIYVTTDREKGALKKLADDEGYDNFIIPDDVGGRYSMLTPVGLLPIACTNADVEDMMRGAGDAYGLYNNVDLIDNDCYKYAAARNILYGKGKGIEIMVNYEPSLHFFTEWWKQLYGESEGKDSKGIFPAGADFTTDLHSMGQYIQDGVRNLFETVLNIQSVREDMVVESDEENLDGLNYLAGKTMHYVNSKAMEGTILAHNDGGVPNLIFNIPEMNSYYFGKLVYLFEKACGISGYILGVNPFDQPGVEAYKKNMFALLGKP